MGGAVIVIPCFDEERRLPDEAVHALARDTSVLLVDDGSRDATLGRLERLASSGATIDVLALPRHVGKAEAVRQGMLEARRRGAALLGYCDADFSTPASEVVRLVEVLRGTDDILAVLGSRVGLLGHRVVRSPARTAVSRAFSVASSAVLRVQIHDTQCGAKVFRGGPLLDACLDTPFASSWGFDAELIGRLLCGRDDTKGAREDQLLEVPLASWRHVRGSKLRAPAAVGAATDIVRLRSRLDLWQRRA